MKVEPYYQASFFEGVRWPLYPDHCDSIAELRRAAAANLRRRERKIAVFKAIGASGLLFLICGSVGLIGYAISG